MVGNIVPISFMLTGIQSFNSPNRKALPQRSNRNIVVDSLRESRDVNGKLYSMMKDEFIRNVLFNGHSDCSGVYFFLKREANSFNPFYIGISGTRRSYILVSLTTAGRSSSHF